MKNIIVTLSFVLIGLVFFGCKDVINSDRNVLIEPKDGTDGLSNIIEFHFVLDVQIIKNNDTAAVGNAIIPYTWSKSFFINNVSKDSLITITDISMLAGNFFSVYALNTLPVQIFPDGSNSTNQFSLMIRTKDLNPGIYLDKVIINRNPKLGFYVKINVN